MFILMRPNGEHVVLTLKGKRPLNASLAKKAHNPLKSTWSGVMADRIRPLDELLGMLEEAARTNGYFEIGPDETRTLWAEFNRLRGSPGPRAKAILARTFKLDQDGLRCGFCDASIPQTNEPRKCCSDGRIEDERSQGSSASSEG
jgi:hypothetical protein